MEKPFHHSQEAGTAIEPGCHARSRFQALETVDRRQSRPARTLARERLDGFEKGADAEAGGADCEDSWGTLMLLLA